MEDSSAKNQTSFFKFWFSKFKKLLQLVLVGILFVFVVGIGFYSWHNSRNFILPLAPVDSILYVQIQNPLWPWQKYQLADLPFDNFYIQADQVFSLENIEFKDDILPYVNQGGFMLLPGDQADELDWIFVFKLKDCYFGQDCQRFNDFKIKLEHQAYNLPPDIFVLASSEAAFNKIDSVKAGRAPSLNTRVDESQLGPSFLVSYFNPKQLPPRISPSVLVADVFSKIINDDIYLKLDRRKDSWNFEVVGNQNFNPPSFHESLIENLPQDFELFLSGINLSKLLAFWLVTEQSLSESLNGSIYGLERVYNLNLADISSLLDQAGEIIIFSQQNQSFLDFEFAFVLPYQPDQLNSWNTFEAAVSAILAQKLPQEFKRLLPDGTDVIELKADPQVFQWQNEAVSDQSRVRLLREERINFELAYLIIDQKVIVSNSINRILDLIQNTPVSLSQMVRRCGFSGKTDMIIFNNSNIFTKYFSSNEILIKLSGLGQPQGCITR